MLQDRGALCEERVRWAADTAAGAVRLPPGKRRRARPILQQPLARLLLTTAPAAFSVTRMFPLS